MPRQSFYSKRPGQLHHCCSLSGWQAPSDHKLGERKQRWHVVGDVLKRSQQQLGVCLRRLVASSARIHHKLSENPHVLFHGCLQTDDAARASATTPASASRDFPRVAKSSGANERYL